MQTKVALQQPPVGGGCDFCRIGRLNPAAGLFWLVMLMAIRPRPRRRPGGG